MDRPVFISDNAFQAIATDQPSESLISARNNEQKHPMIKPSPKCPILNKPKFPFVHKIRLPTQNAICSEMTRFAFNLHSCNVVPCCDDFNTHDGPWPLITHWSLNFFDFTNGKKAETQEEGGESEKDVKMAEVLESWSQKGLDDEAMCENLSKKRWRNW
jgi:hypothetical protein